MLERLTKEFEGVATTVRFLAELCTQSFPKKWLVDGLVDTKHKFVAGILGRLKLVGSHPRVEGYAFNRSGLSLAHTLFPLARLRNGLHQQQMEKGAGQGIRDDAMFDHIKQYERGGEEGTLLDDSIQSRLSRWLGLRLPQVRVHTGPLFDELLDKRSAHAMTLGGDIYVRSEKYHPERAEGLALLGHEMTHVAQQYITPSLPTVNGTARQEQDAIISEQFVHRRMRADSSPGNRLEAALQKPGGEPSPSIRHVGASGPMTPLFADAGRSAPPTELSVPASMLSEGEMFRIKQEVYRDIMQKIRIEIERGA